ncbi:MAG: dihydrofolate reductase, partial [Acidobacteria bacterium]|nr:dihydrofolate reductase [Acidobacteriota bacterium]
IGIVAISENYAIGKNGKLPWHYPADLKHFRQTTTGHALVMGSATWKSIGKPLPNRLNLVLSRSAEIENGPNVLSMRGVDEIRALAKFLKGDVFVIGGAKTYESFTNEIDEWIVTRIPMRIEDADVFMPADFLDEFELREMRDIGDYLRVEIFRRGPH